MTIYINGHEVTAHVLPADTPTLDETLETFSFALEFNDKPMPYAPCQKVQVITDLNEKINLFLVTDQVELVSSCPLKYKHNITCVQNTRVLSKHLVKNSVFSTPAYLEKSSYNAVTISLANRQPTDPHSTPTGNENNKDEKCNGTYAYSRYITPNDGSETIELATLDVGSTIREKIEDAYFELGFTGIWCGAGTVDLELPGTLPSEWRNDVKSAAAIESAATLSGRDWSWVEGLQLVASKSGSTITEAITRSSLGLTGSGWYPLNQRIKFPRIKELASQGYTTFEIRFPSTLSQFMAGRTYPYRGGFWMMLMFQAKIIVKTYYYSAYDILHLLLNRQRRKRRDLNGGIIQEDALFKLPTASTDAELYELLTTTGAPNFTFTQSTMYECIADVFRLFDAIFTMDEDGYLGIDYFNNLDNRNVSTTLKKTSQSSSSSEDKYTNGLVAYYQDARTVEEYPSSMARISGTEPTNYATIKTKNLGVPGQNDFIFKTPHSIDSILECYMFAKSSTQNTAAKGSKTTVNTDFNLASSSQSYVSLGTSSESQLIGFPQIDVSHFIVPKDLWFTLPTSKNLFTNNNLSDPTILNQINTIFYERGSNIIDLSYTYSQAWWGTTKFAFDNMLNCALWKFCGATDIGYLNQVASVFDIGGAWNYVYMKIRYVTTVDGRTKIESIDRKYDGETLIDQYNGAVDLNKMGINILGLTLKLGNPTLNVTQKISDWEDRIKIGDIYKYENKTWIANVVNYTILENGKVQASIQFVQNFNALAMRTQLLRVKRMSNISRELTVKSEDNLMEYVYFAVGTDTIEVDQDKRTIICIPISVLEYDIAQSLGAIVNESNLRRFDVAGFERLDGLVRRGPYYIPLIKYGAGNAMCFEVSYEETMNAGNQTRLVTSSSAWNYDEYFTKTVLYTDDSGFADHIYISIYDSNNLTIDSRFPYIYPTTDTDRALWVNRLSVYKQPNEIFALNYELTFLPIDGKKDFIGTRFIQSNFLIDSSSRQRAALKFRYSPTNATNPNYSVLDIYGKGNSDVTISSVSLTTGDTTFSIRFTLSASVTAKSFAICDSDNAILFASNRELNGNQICLTFSTTRSRVDDKVLEEL